MHCIFPVSIPSTDELLADIMPLENWCAQIEKRSAVQPRSVRLDLPSRFAVAP